MIDKTNTDPMDDAYKLLSGAPAQDAVSVAAKGGDPESDKQQRLRTNMRTEDDELCTDIDKAYANLFESLSVILRNK